MAAALFTIPCARVSADEAYITLRAAPTVSDAVSTYLAEIAKPNVVELDAGTDVRPFIRRFCGTITSAYLRLLRGGNPNLTGHTVSQKGSVTFPACFHVTGNKTVIAGKGDSLATLAQKFAGISGPQTLSDIAAANRDTTVVKPGDKIVLPFSTQPVRYELKPGVDPNAAVTRLKRLSASAIQDPNARPLIKADPNPSDEQLIAAVDTPAVDGAQPQSGPACAGGTALWPFDAPALLKVLQANLAALNKLGVAPAPVTVGIADTGIDGFDTNAFPRSDFDINVAELLGGTDEDRDGNGYFHDVYGANVYDAHGQPVAFRDYFAGDHGTHIAGLALGGPAFGQLAAEANFPSLAKLKIIEVVRQSRTAGANGPITSYGSPAGGLEKAIAYGADQKALVVNVSFVAPVRPVGIEATLANNRRTVLVAAAGNDQANLDQKPLIYPAGYGGNTGDYKDQVISVAAHDLNFDLAPFSNWGTNRVDLAAAGCDLESNGYDGGLVRYSGTSQAAPLVSFAASLLFAEHLPTARAVKARILASVDVMPGLSGKVYAEGALNVIKAASSYYDVLELRGSRGQIRIGWIVGPATFQICDRQEPVDISHVLKITPAYVDTKGRTKTRYLLIDDEKKWSVVTCSPTLTGTIQFRELNDTQPRPISWADVLDLVPAYYGKHSN